MFHLTLKGRRKQHGDFKAGGQQMCTKGIRHAKQFLTFFMLKKIREGGYLAMSKNKTTTKNKTENLNNSYKKFFSKFLDFQQKHVTQVL